MAKPVTISLSTRRRRIPYFEIDEALDFESIKWADFLPSERGTTSLELVAAIACHTVFILALGKVLVGVQLGIVVLISLGHIFLLLLFTGLRICNRYLDCCNFG